MIKYTACNSSRPITVQAGHCVRQLALNSNRSYGYAFRVRAAPTKANPAPAPVIQVRHAGYSYHAGSEQIMHIQSANHALFAIDHQGAVDLVILH